MAGNPKDAYELRNSSTDIFWQGWLELGQHSLAPQRQSSPRLEAQNDCAEDPVMARPVPEKPKEPQEGLQPRTSQ